MYIFCIIIYDTRLQAHVFSCRTEHGGGLLQVGIIKNDEEGYYTIYPIFVKSFCEKGGEYEFRVMSLGFAVMNSAL